MPAVDHLGHRTVGPLTHIPSDYLAQVERIVPPLQAEDDIGGNELQCINWLVDRQICEREHGQVEKAIKVLKATKFITDLAAALATPQQFPIGIQGAYGVFEYELAVDNFRITPTGSKMDVIVGLTMDPTKPKMFFAGIDIPYSNRYGFTEDAGLALLSDEGFEVNEGKTAIIFRGKRKDEDGGTYIRFNCDGITSIGVSLTAIFNNTFIKPATKGDYVIGNASFTYSGESGFRLDDMSMTPFMIDGFEEVAFEIQSLYIDLDEENTTVPFIDDYFQMGGSQSGLTQGQWTGFYAKKVAVHLMGKNFRQNNRAPLQLEAHNLLVDQLGVTATFHVEQEELISLDSGVIGNWSFSVDAVWLDMVMSEIQSFGLAGLVNVPILDKKGKEQKVAKDSTDLSSTAEVSKEASLGYLADFNILKRTYSFEIASLGGEFSVPMAVADLTIDQGSYVRVVLGEKDTVQAFLNGSLQLRGQLSQTSEIKSPPVYLHGLFVSNRAPFFHVQRIDREGTGEGGGLGKFGFSINGPPQIVSDPKNEQVKTIVFPGVTLDLGGLLKNQTAISADIGVRFFVADVDGKQKWYNNGIKVSKVGISNVDVLPILTIVKAELSFYNNDPTYGTGFAGGGTVKFDFLPDPITMTAAFGTIEDYNYSYVDLHATTGSEGAGSGFQLCAVSGGYYKNMTRKPVTNVGEDGNYDPNQLGGYHNKDNPLVPKKGDSGFRAAALVKFGKTARAGAEIRIDKVGNVEGGPGTSYTHTYFVGLVEILPADKGCFAEVRADLPENPDSNTYTDYELSNGGYGGYIKIKRLEKEGGRELSASFGIAAPLGIFEMKIVGDYSSDNVLDKWHLAIGRPENRFAISYPNAVRNKALNIDIILTGYFMVGNSEKMPKEQPQPYAVNPLNSDLLTEAFQALKKDGAYADIFQGETIKSGTGIAFGAHFGIGVQVDFAEIFYARVGADVGFDILFLSDARTCANATPEGLGSWYMLGQSYAAISADVGLKFKKRYFRIFNAGAAVVIQGGMPKPAYGRGFWLIKYDILAGLVKGEVQGDFKFGAVCDHHQSVTLTDDPLHEISSTKEEGSEIWIGNDFVLDFNLAVDSTFEAAIFDNPEDTTADVGEYIFNLDEAGIYDESGRSVNCRKRYSAGRSLVTLVPFTYLDPGGTYTLRLKGAMYEKQEGGAVSLFKGGDGSTLEIDTTVKYKVAAFDTRQIKNEIARWVPVQNARNVKSGQVEAVFFKSINGLGLTISGELRGPSSQIIVPKHILGRTQRNFGFPFDIDPLTQYSFYIFGEKRGFGEFFINSSTFTSSDDVNIQ